MNHSATPYVPQPLDTSAVQLPPLEQALAEAMAKNTHEVWAAGRAKEGWTYGPTRDDAAKQHPCMVPYEELSEAEKQYDRATSQEALKFLLASGYRLIKED